MKAYRPYETFGMIDQERHFDNVDELVEHYTPWCKGNLIHLECACVDSEKDKVIFTGTNLNHLNNLLDEGENEEEALDEAMVTLIVEGCTEEQMSELKTETIG